MLFRSHLYFSSFERCAGPAQPCGLVPSRKTRRELSSEREARPTVLESGEQYNSAFWLNRWHDHDFPPITERRSRCRVFVPVPCNRSNRSVTRRTSSIVYPALTCDLCALSRPPPVYVGSLGHALGEQNIVATVLGIRSAASGCEGLLKSDCDDTGPGCRQTMAETGVPITAHTWTCIIMRTTSIMII